MNDLNNFSRLAHYIALFTSLVTIIAFGIAILTPPISGPFCTSSCIDYPYLNIISRFPRDYLWVFPAIIMNLAFVALVACVHQYASPDRKIFSQIALSFSIISATVLIIDYYIQISVIQPSIEKGQLDGIAILTQYNPHGIFIALEEIGYLIMSLAFLVLVPVFSNKSSLEKAIRLILLLSFILTICAIFLILICFGTKREYRFEIAAITINWTVLAVTGILLSRIFKRLQTEKWWSMLNSIN